MQFVTVGLEEFQLYIERWSSFLKVQLVNVGDAELPLLTISQPQSAELLFLLL